MDLKGITIKIPHVNGRVIRDGPIVSCECGYVSGRAGFATSTRNGAGGEIQKPVLVKDPKPSRRG